MDAVEIQVCFSVVLNEPEGGHTDDIRMNHRRRRLEIILCVNPDCSTIPYRIFSWGPGWGEGREERDTVLGMVNRFPGGKI